jgi:hypothetical protein
MLALPMLVSPDELVTAAQRLTTMQSDIGAANLATATSTTRITAAAQDEISKNVAGVFSGYGQQLHAVVEHTGVLGTHQFAQRLGAAASSYSRTEASNSVTLLDLLNGFINDVNGTINDVSTSFEKDPTGTILALIILPFVAPILVSGVALFLALVIFNDLTGNAPPYGY